MSRLFDPEPTPATTRWTGTRLPAIYRGDRFCGACSTGITVPVDSWTVEPMFAMHGHGAAITIEATICLACGTVHIVGETASRPTRLAKVG